MGEGRDSKMSLHITPEMMEWSYELIRSTPPYRRWGLPEADAVVFGVMSCNDRAADYERRADGTHVIRVNTKWVGTLERLLLVMRHEVLHMHLNIACPNDQAHHGKRFNEAARQICRRHVLCPKSF